VLPAVCRAGTAVELSRHAGPTVAMIGDDGPVEVWEFERDVDAALAVRCALDRVEQPDMRAVVTSSSGDHVTIEILEGALIDPTSLLYVQRRGLFEVLRAEEVGRSRLLLRAYPSRS
jgi:hypothetical protein